MADTYLKKIDNHSINFIKFKIMEAMAVLEKQQQFDFQNNGIEVMNFETLQRTYKENDIYGKPVQGIYHYQVLQRMMDICEKYNLDYEVEEIFAAQNRNKTQPGVSILPQVEQTLGEKAVEAHILRRIFATIRIKDWETDELTTTLVIAYHQDGIQAAIGPCVKICHNQCILSPERSICNYGKNKVTTEGVFETVDGWLANFEVNMNEDIARIQRLKRRIVSLEEVYMYIGLLTALRVSHDSSDRNLSSSVETYPLNQSQISIFTEEVLKLAREKGQITAWDLYSVATEIYKPGRTDFPALIPQNGAMAELLLSRLPAEVEIQDAVLVVAVTNSPKHDFNRCKSATCRFLFRDTKSARDKNGTKPRKNKVKDTSPEISLVEYLCFVCKGTNLSLEKRGEIPISLIHNSFSYHCTPNVVIANGFDLKQHDLRKSGVKFCFAL